LHPSIVADNKPKIMDSVNLKGLYGKINVANCENEYLDKFFDVQGSR